jgi:WD40 repeat protein
MRRLQVSDPVQYLAVSANGKLLAVETQASNATNSRVDVLDMATGTTLHSYPVAGNAAGLAFSFDSRELASLGSGIDVRDIASGHELFSPSVPSEAESIALSPTAPELAVGTADGKIYLFDVRSGKASESPITAAASNVFGLAYSSDGRLLAAALRDGTTVLVDRASGELLGNPFPKVTGALPTVLFAANRDLVINYVGTALAWPTDVATLERYACQVAGRDITPAEWANVLPNRPYQHVCP